MTSTVLEAINRQISNEFSASFSYLAMASWCEHRQFTGAGHWLRLQSQEEYAHAMKLFDFVLARNHQSSVTGFETPRSDFGSLLELFEAAQQQEQAVSRQIDGLYELAFNEKVFAAMAELQWFVTEQVEEEKTMREIVSKLRMVSSDSSAILDFDRELGTRAAAPKPAA
jgi:ferritin